MRNKILFISSILLVAALAVAFAPGLIAQAQTTPTSASAPRTISVVGSGKAFLDPDIAYIYIGVHTEEEDAKVAVETNNEGSQKVMDALKAMNINAKDIQTTNFTIYPMQNYDPEGKVTGTRYAVDNTVYVTLRDLDQLGDVLEAAIGAGANSINGIYFDVADRTAALAEAREAALANAEEQAQDLAGASELKLGEIQSISSFAPGYPSPMFEGRGGAGLVMDAASVPISPGQLVVSVEMNVVYAIQ